MNKHPDYWRVKTAVLEAQIAQMKAQGLVNTARATQARVLTDAGLDPGTDYEFVDASESIIPA